MRSRVSQGQAARGLGQAAVGPGVQRVFPSGPVGTTRSASLLRSKEWEFGGPVSGLVRVSGVIRRSFLRPR